MVVKVKPVFKQQEMILISFYRASEGTTTRVPYEELVLQLWLAGLCSSASAIAVALSPALL